MKSFTTYEDHNVDEDPVIFLPCGHFFAASTLDGCTSIQTVYDSNDSGEFTGLKSLRGIASEKPKQCPECRAAIHSVRRYGRLLRLVEIRSLERKHLMVVDGVLENLEPLVESNHLGALQKLIKVEKTIRRSPMRIIFEAYGGVEVIETAPPPAAPLIKCLELKAIAFENRVTKYGDNTL